MNGRPVALISGSEQSFVFNVLVTSGYVTFTEKMLLYLNKTQPAKLHNAILQVVYETNRMNVFGFTVN